jgi:ammonium transporter, Amt family
VPSTWLSRSWCPGYCAIGLKHKLGFDDALDVVGVHLVGGAFGAISLGFLAAYPLLDGQRKGLFYGGGVTQLGVQVLGPVAVGLYSFTVAWILGKIIDKTMGFRVSEEEEAIRDSEPVAGTGAR